MSRRFLAVTLCCVFALAACGSDDTPKLVVPTPGASASATPQVTGIAAGDAKIIIKSPTEGDTVGAAQLEVVTEVTGFELVDKLGEKAKPGEGHIIYYLGAGYEIPVQPDRPATSGGSGAFTSYTSYRPSYTWENVGAGRQTLTVQLVNNDNTPLSPSQSAQVTVTVNG